MTSREALFEVEEGTQCRLGVDHPQQFWDGSRGGPAGSHPPFRAPTQQRPFLPHTWLTEAVALDYFLETAVRAAKIIAREGGAVTPTPPASALTQHCHWAQGSVHTPAASPSCTTVTATGGDLHTALFTGKEMELHSKITHEFINMKTLSY